MNNEKLMRPQVKPCPICGNTPLLDSCSLDHGNGHGYPGCYVYLLKCDVCGRVEAQSNSIGCSDNEAKIQAIINWNAEVDKIEHFLANKNK